MCDRRRKTIQHKSYIFIYFIFFDFVKSVSRFKTMWAVFLAQRGLLQRCRTSLLEDYTTVCTTATKFLYISVGHTVQHIYASIFTVHGFT